MRILPDEAVRCFDHLLRVGNFKLRDVHENRIALFFGGYVLGRRYDRRIDGAGRQSLHAARLGAELNDGDIFDWIESKFFSTNRIAVSVPEPKRLMAIFFPLIWSHLVIPFGSDQAIGSVLTQAAIIIVSAP